MRLEEMMNKESCERIWGYRPTEEHLVILNDAHAMRKLLINIWEEKEKKIEDIKQYLMYINKRRNNMSRSLKEQITRKVNSYIPLTQKDKTSKMLIKELMEIIEKCLD